MKTSLAWMATALLTITAYAAAQTDDAQLNRLLTDFGGHKAVTKPSRDSLMGFARPTQVREVLIRGGQTVKLGQLLIRGDDAEAAANLKFAEQVAKNDSQVRLRERTEERQRLNFERIDRASRDGASNPQEHDDARIAFESAKLELENERVGFALAKVRQEQAQAALDQVRLFAPFDGIVDNVLVNVGQGLNETDKAIRVVQIDPIWIDVPTPTRETIQRVTKVGDSAWVLMEVGGALRVMNAKVIEVSPVADAASQTRRIRVELPNPEGSAPGGRLVPGDPAFVRFSEPEKPWLEKAAAWKSPTVSAR